MVARNFRLTPMVSQRVKYFIQKQRDGQLGALTEDEKAEHEKLMKEFV